MNAESGLLKDLNDLLKKHTKTTGIGSSDPHSRQSEENAAANTKYRHEPTLQTAAESIFSLLSHLVELEHKSRLAESRGELRPLYEIGQVIHDARKRQRLTVETLADLAGVGTVTIHKIEKGSLQLQIPKVLQVAEALGLELLVSTR